MKYVLTALAAASAFSLTVIADNVDKALEGGDQAAILKLLRQQAKAAPTAVAPKVEEAVPPTVESASTSPAAPTPAIRTLDDNASSESFSSEELQQIRARLAAELEAAKAKAVADEQTTAPVVKTEKESSGLLGKLFGGKKDKGQSEAPSRPAFARPDLAAGNMKSNRDALDALLTSSRQDVVRQALDQAAGGGQSGSVNIVGEEKDWREAGPNAWKYNGEWTGGTMSGQGRLEFADGWTYVGSWINGTMSGQGTLVHPDGTKYEGQWVNGKMHGLGKLTYPDGWQFIGQWADGQITGQGTLVHPGQ